MLQVNKVVSTNVCIAFIPISILYNKNRLIEININEEGHYFTLIKDWKAIIRKSGSSKI